MLMGGLSEEIEWVICGWIDYDTGRTDGDAVLKNGRRDAKIPTPSRTGSVGEAEESEEFGNTMRYEWGLVREISCKRGVVGHGFVYRVIKQSKSGSRVGWCGVRLVRGGPLVGGSHFRGEFACHDFDSGPNRGFLVFFFLLLCSRTFKGPCWGNPS